MPRDRQLAYNIKSTASEGPSAWRQHSVAGDAPNDLLQRRGLPPLSLQVPLAAGYGIKYGERAMYVRTIDQPLPPSLQPAARAKPGADIAMAAAGQASPSAAALHTPTLRFATPPRLGEQASKRRLLAPGAAAVARAAGASGHLIATARSPSPVVIAVLSAAPSTCSSMSVTPHTAASSISSSAAGSPLVALFYRVKDLLSPAPQRLGISAY